MIEPYKTFKIDYDGIEYDGLDEKIEKNYKKSIQLYESIINNVYKIYPTLPTIKEDLDNIDFIEFLKSGNSTITFDLQNVTKLEEECIKLDKVIKLLKDTITKKESLDNQYFLIKNVGNRLILAIEMHKRNSSYSDDIIKTSHYKQAYTTPLSLENNLIQYVGSINYVNWSSVYHASVDRYMVTDANRTSRFVCTNFPSEYLNDPKFISFFNRVMLNKDYMNHSIKYNGGYLGEPEQTEDGNYKLVFDNEAMAAAIQYDKLRKAQAEQNK